MGLLSSITGNRRTGDYNLSKKNYSEAIKYYDLALRDDPDDYKSLKGRGWALIGLGNYGLAFNSFEAALKLNPIDEKARKGKISALLGLGNENVENRNFQDALNFFEGVLDINHSNSSTFEITKQFDMAKEILRGKASRMASGHLDEFFGIRFGDIDALIGKGNALGGLKDLEGAINCFSEVLRIQPENANALLGKARCLFAVEDYTNAVKYYDLVLNEDNDYRALNGKGWVLIKLGEWNRALTCFNEVLSMKSSDECAEKGKIKASLTLGDIKVKNGEFEEAFTHYSEVLSIEPNNSWALVGKIEALQHINNNLLNRREFSNALEGLKDAINATDLLLNSDSLSMENSYYVRELQNEFLSLQYPALMGKAYECMEISDFQGARNSFRDALKIRPDDEEASQGELKSLLGSGRVSLELNDFDKALKYYQEAVSISEEDTEALNGIFSALLGLGNYLLESKDFSGAFNCFKDALRLKPENLEAVYGTGMALNGLGKYEKALNYFETILKTRSEDLNALRGEALALNGAKNFKAAKIVFDQILDMKPDDTPSLEGKARTLLELEDFENAIEYFDKVLTVKPDFDVKAGKIKALKCMGTNALKDGDFDKALEYTESALKSLDAETQKPFEKDILDLKLKALKGKGNSYFSTGNFEEAVKCYNTFLSINPDTNILCSKGKALNRLNDFKGAIQCFEAVLKSEPENIPALKGSLESFMAVNDFEKALNFINRSLKLDITEGDKEELLKLKSSAFTGKGKNILGLTKYSLKTFTEKKFSADGAIDFFDSDSVQSMNWDGALKNFENALSTDKNPEALNGKLLCLTGKGYTLLKSHDFKNAEPYFDDVLKNVKSLTALRGKGLALNGLKSFSNACSGGEGKGTYRPKTI